jgi:hypothetical protein
VIRDNVQGTRGVVCNWSHLRAVAVSISASGATGSPEAEAICSRELHEGLLGDDLTVIKFHHHFDILIGTHRSRSQSGTPEQGDRASLTAANPPCRGTLR